MDTIKEMHIDIMYEQVEQYDIQIETYEDVLSKDHSFMTQLESELLSKYLDAIKACKHILLKRIEVAERS